MAGSGSPIGSNRGLQTRAQSGIIIEQATVPVRCRRRHWRSSHGRRSHGKWGAERRLVNTAIGGGQ